MYLNQHNWQSWELCIKPYFYFLNETLETIDTVEKDTNSNFFSVWFFMIFMISFVEYSAPNAFIQLTIILMIYNRRKSFYETENLISWKVFATFLRRFWKWAGKSMFSEDQLDLFSYKLSLFEISSRRSVDVNHVLRALMNVKLLSWTLFL